MLVRTLRRIKNRKRKFQKGQREKNVDRREELREGNVGEIGGMVMMERLQAGVVDNGN
jgi:hypothetical protein